MASRASGFQPAAQHFPLCLRVAGLRRRTRASRCGVRLLALHGSRGLRRHGSAGLREAVGSAGRRGSWWKQGKQSQVNQTAAVGGRGEEGAVHRTVMRGPMPKIRQTCKHYNTLTNPTCNHSTTLTMTASPTGRWSKRAAEEMQHPSSPAQ